ncbi:MAG: RNA polymerase sigma factor [Clostridia bacterium]|nr:RNA polymerase sigma factor [Clostridia bacterium]
MNDTEILALFFERNENAITECQKKHGKYCRAIARNILGNEQDTEECINDVFLKAWNAIPPHRPEKLSTYLGKITRNQAIKIYEKQNAAKRQGDNIALAAEELSDCLPSEDSTENSASRLDFSKILNDFLAGLSKEARTIFVKRYWYLYPVKEISKDMGIGESKVKMSLSRTREKLKIILQKEGFEI